MAFLLKKFFEGNKLLKFFILSNNLNNEYPLEYL